MLKGLQPERIAFQDVIYISRIRWEWSYGSVAFLGDSRNLSDLFAWEKKLFQSNWSLFRHKYSYEFRILNTESYFIIILKFKKYFKMLKYLKRNLTLSIITCHFYHHHYHLYYYYYFVTVITLDKYRSPHEFYLVPLMQPWRMCYIMSHCTCNAIIFNTLTTRQFLFFYWQSTIRMIDYSAELLTQLHMVYHSSL